MIDEERSATETGTSADVTEGQAGGNGLHAVNGTGDAGHPGADDEPALDLQAASDELAEGRDSSPELNDPAALEAAPPSRDFSPPVERMPPPPAPADLEPVEENSGLIATMPEVARPPRQYFQETELPTWLPPEFEQQEQRAVSPPLGRSPGRLPAIVLAILMSGMFAMFLLIEPTPMWLALLSAIVAAIGTDGVLRSIRREVFEVEEGPDTVPHLFLPALFALSVPLLIEENLPSYWVIPAALVAGFTFVLVVLAEVPAEAEEDDEFRGRARFVSVASTYFVAFALFSLTYVFELGLRESVITIALVSVLLAFELLREGEIDPLETLLLACVVGVVVAEARWVLQYMPLDRYPAGLALLLTFYFVTGMVHAYMTRHIGRAVTVEYSVVTGVGLALVIAARATGVA
jgi:hypothetical protein